MSSSNSQSDAIKLPPQYEKMNTEISSSNSRSVTNRLPPEYENMSTADMQKKIVQNLSCLPVIPPWHSLRWNILTSMMDLVRLYNNISLPPSIIIILKNMAQNANEPMLYRCAASYHLYNLEKPSSPSYLTDALRFCNLATALERERIVEVTDLREKNDSDDPDLYHKRVTVGNQLDQYKLYIEREIRYANNPLKFCQEQSKGCVQDEFIDDMFKLFQIFNFKEIEGIISVPEVTSSLIEQVKNLPQRKMTVYLFRDADFQNSNSYPVVAKRTYRAFTVDANKLKDLTERKKKKHHAFKYMTFTATGYKHSEQKAIIGTFAKACLKPFVIMPSTNCETPPFRPDKVLLENKDEANHAQVKTFLAMMGCTKVGTINPDLANIVNLNKHLILKASSKNMFDNIDGGISLPTFNAVSKGYTCLNCNKSDMNIKQCECKKAYFCNKECQIAKWAAHKKDHKKFMKKLKAKKANAKK